VKLIETLVPADFRSSITDPLRRYYIGTFVSCTGSGLTYSLFVIYLHNVRGFSIDFRHAPAVGRRARRHLQQSRMGYVHPTGSARYASSWSR